MTLSHVVSCAVVTPLLITIGPSHYCEKARWALQRAHIAFRESAHAPVIHLLRTLPTGRRSTPLLMADGEIIADSTDILVWVDKRTAPAERLFPEDDASRAEVNRWEELFDVDLGPAVRRVAYFHLLPEKEHALSALSRGVPRSQMLAFRVAYPLARRVIVRSLGVTAAGAERSLQKVREVLRQVDAALEGGRRYLVGDRFSAADLTFAALAGPLLQPRNPDLTHLPAALAALAREARSTPAGRFGLRLLHDERG